MDLPILSITLFTPLLGALLLAGGRAANREDEHESVTRAKQPSTPARRGPLCQHGTFPPGASVHDASTTPSVLMILRSVRQGNRSVALWISACRPAE